MTMRLQSVSLPRRTSAAVALDRVEYSHGVTPNGSRMYARFFGQDHVLIQPQDHRNMLLDTLQAAVAARPELARTRGIGIYAKTQTHNSLACDTWLAEIFAQAGLSDWEVLTFSMTNCASALAAVHMFAAQDRPFLVLSGEKAFHATGSRLSVGLLSEAPVAATFGVGGQAGRPLRASFVRHMPRFYRNPDDMAEPDRRALQGEFEAGFATFLREVIAADPTFMALNPVLVPYNLNVPLVRRVLEQIGLAHRVLAGHSGQFGHAFCSDPFLNLALLPVPDDTPVLLFCAGMGVTFAAVLIEGAAPCNPNQPQTDGENHVSYPS